MNSSAEDDDYWNTSFTKSQALIFDDDVLSTQEILAIGQQSSPGKAEDSIFSSTISNKPTLLPISSLVHPKVLDLILLAQSGDSPNKESKPEPQETVAVTLKRLVLGRTCSLHVHRSLKSKKELLDGAIAIGDGNAILTVTNLSVLVAGMGLVWPSPVLVKLRGNDTVLSRPISEEEGSWIVAIPFLSGMVANFFTGQLLDSIGRKYCVILSCLPRIAVALMVLFAKEFWVILLARILTGPLDSLTFTAVPTYASEISSKEVRGALGTLLQIIASIGILITLGIGPFVSYVSLNSILICVSVACSMPLLFLPDTPYYLFSKGKTEEAKNVLIKLRGSEALANEEIKEYQVASQDEGNIKIGELIKNKLFLKAALISIVICFCSQANGYTAVTFYLQTVLENTHTSVKPETASVVIGSIQLIASFCTTVFTDRFGRKSILICTTIGVAVGLIGLGAFFKVQEFHQVTGFINYLPLASIILIVFCHSAGLASILWVLISEIFDGRTRAIGASISILSATVTGFVISKIMPLLTSSLGPAFIYWMFSVVCILFCVFIAVVIPETKGRSFAEIQAILGKKKNSDEEKE